MHNARYQRILSDCCVTFLANSNMDIHEYRTVTNFLTLEGQSTKTINERLVVFCGESSLS